ncbi:MAG TPA: class I SAM-dependent methyltransferase, partial [Ectothiorhodospiraceae bacterium]|nr:class I SAM-dependent methyltransferase [Ectothiorhodospiraceae bacterium]
MAKITPFEQLAHKYDEWFDIYPFVYDSELEAIRGLLPESGTGLEVGVGTGRFAEPLGIFIGIEPSRSMGKMAQDRGIEIIDAVAESLPLPDESFDYILFVTTVCFLDSMAQAFREALRVLKSSGAILIGLIDRESPIG